MRELCALLDMSPTPVREAMRLLEAEGLIVDEPHRGMSVSRPAVGSLGDLYDLRATLEGYATRLATERLGGDDLDAIEAAAAAHREARLSGDYPRAAECNFEFHNLIYQAANNSPYLLEFIARLWNVFPWNANWTLEMRADHAVNEHGAVLEALRARDARKAEQLMRRHILSTKPLVTALLGDS